jgi:hypothetical protein
MIHIIICTYQGQDEQSFGQPVGTFETQVRILGKKSIFPPFLVMLDS